MRIQARDIVRYARKNGITLTRWEMGRDGKACARSVLAMMAIGKENFYKNYREYNSDEVRKATGLTSNQLLALESGFENWGAPSWGDKRYYNVGRNVAKIVGLPLNN